MTINIKNVDEGDTVVLQSGSRRVVGRVVKHESTALVYYGEQAIRYDNLGVCSLAELTITDIVKKPSPQEISKLIEIRKNGRWRLVEDGVAEMGSVVLQVSVVVDGDKYYAPSVSVVVAFQ